MSSISTGTTTTTGYVVASDTTGALVLKTGASATTAVTIDTSQNATFAQTANLPNTFGFKNRIINGAMVIDQRNAGASITPANGAYCPDRWRTELTQASKYSVQQVSDAPDGFVNSLNITSLSAYSVTSTDQFNIRQGIEGFNTADLMYGTANAKTVTVSFWVKSSLTGTFGASLSNANNTRLYNFNYTISSANTWEYKTATIAGPTTGSWQNTTLPGIYLRFNLGLGATYGSTTVGSWVSGVDLVGNPSTTSVVGTNGATFYITGVQLEVGTVATSFDYRSYGTELALCQRYYYQTGGESANQNFVVMQAYSTSQANGGVITFAVPMRSVPTFTSSSVLKFYLQSSTGSGSICSAVNYSAGESGTRSGSLAATASAVLTAGNATLFFAVDTGARLNFSAEL